MPKATPAPPPLLRQKTWLILPFGLAVLLTGMVLVQLFDFEQFVARTASYLGWQEAVGGTILAVVVVATQVFAVPFLLRLNISPLARLASALCALFAPALWLLLTTYATVRGSSLAECSCLFRIDVGWSHVMLSVLFLILAIASFIVLNGAQVFRLRSADPDSRI